MRVFEMERFNGKTRVYFDIFARLYKVCVEYKVDDFLTVQVFVSKVEKVSS